MSTNVKYVLTWLRRLLSLRLFLFFSVSCPDVVRAQRVVILGRRKMVGRSFSKFFFGPTPEKQHFQVTRQTWSSLEKKD